MSTVVAVFAHPDDETFICGGTLAKYASAGHQVVLVCATKGEMGRRMGVPPVATRESIASLREAELRSACQSLHIAELQLLGLRDKTLEIQPQQDLTNSILSRLRAVVPDVVLTFHEELGGHPDHCAIGRAATAAFAEYQSEHGAARLYFIIWPKLAQEPERFGLRPEQIVAVDIASQRSAKLAAFRAHRTQSQMNAWVWQDDDLALHKLDCVEYFVQAHPPYARDRRSLL